MTGAIPNTGRSRRSSATPIPFLEALVAIDALLAEMIEAAGSGALIIVMGAWGHRLEHTTVYLNRLLEREGYLRFKRGPASQSKHGLFRLGMTVDRAEQLAHRLNIWKRFHFAVPRGRRASLTGAAFLSYDDVDWSRTRAVALGYLGQIYSTCAASGLPGSWRRRSAKRNASGSAPLCRRCAIRAPASRWSSGSGAARRSIAAPRSARRLI